MASLLGLIENSGLATAAEIELGECAARCFGGTAIEHLAAAGLVSDAELSATLSTRYRVPVANPQQLELPDREAIALLGPDTLAEHRALPLGYEDGHMVVAMSDPCDELACTELGFFAGVPLARRVSGPLTMARALTRCGIGAGVPALGAEEVGYVLLAFALRRAAAAAVLWVDENGLRVGLSTLPASERSPVAPPPLSAGEAPLLARLLERPRAARSPRLSRGERRFFGEVLGRPVTDLVAITLGSVGSQTEVRALLCAARQREEWLDDDFRAAAAYCASGLPFVPRRAHAA